MLTLSSSSSGAGDFTSSWTWGTGIALVTLLVTTWLVINHRRRDQTVRWHQPDYDTARDALLVLNRLSLTTAVEGTTPELRELVDVVSRLRIAEQRSPKLPFGLILAELESYRAHVLPQNHADKLAADESLLDDHLTLARVQGIRLEAARTAITHVQRKIENRTRS
ncbi:hypothetical protein [Streptomyces virginiae]|uniref:hypothetical protein n=1 Tax=Streptomyces virginiae TaxID=1961 RepID=UPI00362F9D48